MSEMGVLEGCGEGAQAVSCARLGCDFVDVVVKGRYWPGY